MRLISLSRQFSTQVGIIQVLRESRIAVSDHDSMGVQPRVPSGVLLSTTRPSKCLNKKPVALTLVWNCWIGFHFRRGRFGAAE